MTPAPKRRWLLLVGTLAGVFFGGYFDPGLAMAGGKGLDILFCAFAGLIIGLIVDVTIDGVP